MNDYWHRRRGFPPEPVESPDELARPHRSLAIVCTQLSMPPRAQRKLVNAWCDVLPTLETVQHVWFLSRVPQDLFDAACRMPRLEGLYVKWSGVTSIDALAEAKRLRAFHLGHSAQLRSIDVLASMSRLRWLGFVWIPRIVRLDPIGRLVDLEGLTVDGSIWTLRDQRVESLAPLGRLRRLQFLSLQGLRASDRTLRPLFALRKLKAFWGSHRWDPAEVDELRARNPGLLVDGKRQVARRPAAPPPVRGRRRVGGET